MIAFVYVLCLASLSLGALQVDLGYGVYKGVISGNLTSWKGIRYAAPPTGSLRWQAPAAPATNRTVVTASNYGPQCPQSPFSTEPFALNPGTIGDEDCLSLNVWAPSAATNLPVMIYIHGGGYGSGNSQYSLQSLIDTNGNSFIGVTIQYRLGAFGWLSSADVHSKGVVNAGILDQNLALKWVQKYISLFGGDPTKVTITGESAGAGSVMYHNMAYGGSIGTSLFINSITSSPYLPKQYKYNDSVPTSYYAAFATAAGCPANGSTTFACLVAKDTTTLQHASFNVSASGEYGSWAFLPVTDYSYILTRPSSQLLLKQVNGVRHLSGNNANEGDLFVVPTIATQSDLTAWINRVYPDLTAADKVLLTSYYPVNAATTPEQAAYHIYAESTFVCPSYWLVEAYSAKSSLTSFKYQYSVPLALHTTDLFAIFGPPAVNQGPDFVKAFQTIWGNFITTNNPSISVAIANGANCPTSTCGTQNPASSWPVYSRSNPYLIDLNEMGGVLANVSLPFGANLVVEEYVEPGLMNNITEANAYTFEGGRGKRCDFWRTISGDVPE